MLRHRSGNKGILSFENNQRVLIYSKPVNSSDEPWGVEINGVRGFVPPMFVRELRMINKPETMVDVEPTNEETVPSTNKKIEPTESKVSADSVQKPYEVIDGTTIFNNDFIDASSTQSPVETTVTPELTKESLATEPPALESSSTKTASADKEDVNKEVTDALNPSINNVTPELVQESLVTEPPAVVSSDTKEASAEEEKQKTESAEAVKSSGTVMDNVLNTIWNMGMDDDDTEEDDDDDEGDDDADDEIEVDNENADSSDESKDVDSEANKQQILLDEEKIKVEIDNINNADLEGTLKVQGELEGNVQNLEDNSSGKENANEEIKPVAEEVAESVEIIKENENLSDNLEIGVQETLNNNSDNLTEVNEEEKQDNHEPVVDKEATTAGISSTATEVTEPSAIVNETVSTETPYTEVPLEIGNPIPNVAEYGFIENPISSTEASPLLTQPEGTPETKDEPAVDDQLPTVENVYSTTEEPVVQEKISDFQASSAEDATEITPETLVPTEIKADSQEQEEPQKQKTDPVVAAGVLDGFYNFFGSSGTADKPTEAAESLSQVPASESIVSESTLSSEEGVIAESNSSYLAKDDELIPQNPSLDVAKQEAIENPSAYENAAPESAFLYFGNENVKTSDSLPQNVVGEDSLSLEGTQHSEVSSQPVAAQEEAKETDEILLSKQTECKL